MKLHTTTEYKFPHDLPTIKDMLYMFFSEDAPKTRQYESFIQSYFHYSALKKSASPENQKDYHYHLQITKAHFNMVKCYFEYKREN